MGECLLNTLAVENKSNRACFLKVIAIRFLAHQRFAKRGDGISEPDSNFSQIVKLRAEDKPDGKLTEWMKRKSSKYTSHMIQVILHVMAIQRL